MKTKHVLMRELKFRDGSTAAFPLAVFGDMLDAKREGDRAAQQLAAAHPAVAQVLAFIGVAQLGHRVVEVPSVEGAGLVLVPGEYTPPLRG